MTHRLARWLLASLGGVLLLPVVAQAQGSLAAQGFGYPPGQLSARAAGTGGALGEFDPLSPINPAALGSWGAPGLYVQYSPEFRRVTVPGGTDKASVYRFPVIGGAVPIGQGATVGVAVSTLVDRSFATSRSGTDIVGAYTETSRSSGAINDVRLAGAWRFGRSLQLGAGAHVFTGENRRRRERIYADSTTASALEQPRLSFSGTALSGGAEWQAGRNLAFATSGRIGFALRAYSSDTLLTSATVPSRWGAAVRFSGIAGVALGARADWEGWSKMASLAESNQRAVNGWDVGGGAEVRGPSLLGSDAPLRIGIRHRTLPFSPDAVSTVKETTFSLGAGFPLARDRGNIDLTVERASRTGVPGVSERAWLVDLGFTLRP
ncbi:MAG: hypothetical protein M3068_06685 [Gemmatimonadota bacterium]|nr:hypothetical protein [Gemmatimonadota bacterium]